ncbi:hypothetical protein EJ08DRAFT_656631 [Tothia fuscella]|uniref:MYND-type domain-containing protein n=1 Tax=Tothia fuscella TaxID=1048955 RepID=A0A9P4U2X0_9PEZI|nr:hypothetical protein EJ08DRAFT_656631 [Tothia fuscella]
MFGNYAGFEGSMAQRRVFALNNKGSAGMILLLFVFGLRLDAANQSICLDTAILPLTPSLLRRLNDNLADLDEKEGGILAVNVGDEELILWKNVLPAFVERCRDWEHTSKCEYAIKGSIPLTTEKGQQYLCSCGSGKFPPKLTATITGWKTMSKVCIRAAIPPIFWVPFVEKSFFALAAPSPSNNATGSGTVDNITERIAALKMKKGSCTVCGVKEAKSGGTLNKCAKCHVAEYCSTECQVKDWKEMGHKTVCKKLEEDL